MDITVCDEVQGAMVANTRHSKGAWMDSSFCYWVNEETALRVESSHVQALIDEPSRFGLSESHIEETYARHGEQVGSEGLARDELLREAAANGWIRVRKHVTPVNYISVQTDEIDERIMTIKSFLESLLTSGVIASDETVVVSGYNKLETVSYDWSDGGVSGLLAEQWSA